jgi:HAE1 family hydrophobic/amphiphilic exporter-1
VRLLEPYRSQPEDIERLTIRSQRGELVNLRNVASVRAEAGPVQINRYNRTRQITVLGNLQRDKKVLGEAMTELTGIVEGLGLPAGYTYSFTGEAEAMTESFGYLFFALFLGLIMIYMVLAVVRGFVHPSHHAQCRCRSSALSGPCCSPA